VKKGDLGTLRLYESSCSCKWW